MLDIYELVSQAVIPGQNSTPKLEELQLSWDSKYILIWSEKSLDIPKEDRDLEKVTFRGQLIDGTCIFVDSQNIPHEMKLGDYGKYWVVVPQGSIIGTALAAAYDEIMEAARSSVPHQYKDRVIVPHLTKEPFSLK